MVEIKFSKVFRFNHLEVEFAIDCPRDMISAKREVLYEDEDRRLEYGENEYGFVSYASVQKKDNAFHSAGYVWSSRASVFNGGFGKRCMEVYIVDSKGYRWGADMTVEAVLNILPSEYGVSEIIETNSDDEVSEVSYYICTKDTYGKTYETRTYDYEGDNGGFGGRHYANQYMPGRA